MSLATRGGLRKTGAFFTWVEETALAMCVGAGIFVVFHVALALALTLSLLMAVATGAALFVPWMPRRAQPPAPFKMRRLTLRRP